MKFFSPRKKNKAAGFSLIEIIVSVALFVIIILSATEIFRLVIVGQRKAIASQNVQESLKYFLEASSKEVRMAKKNEGYCSALPGFTTLGFDQIYSIDTAPNGFGDALYFRNVYDECVVYYLGNGTNAGRFIVRRNNLEAPISPAKIKISRLEFKETTIDKIASSFPITRPLIVMRIDAQAFSGNVGETNYKELANIEMQTSLTSRAYR